MADPSFANVALLLKFDGADGGLSFPDSSSYARSPSAIYNTTTSTAKSKFGGASALFNGSNSSIKYPYAANLNTGSGPFTTELWARLDSTVVGCIYSRSSDNYFQYRESALFIDNANAVFYYGVRGQNNTNLAFAFPSSIALDTWVHLAHTRDDSGVHRFFVNGQPSANTYTDSTDLTASAVHPFVIGLFHMYDGVGYNSFAGSMDEFRHTIGVARYVDAFTPPDEPFPTTIHPEARAVRLAVSVLSPHLTPNDISPLAGHLRLRGLALAEARAMRMSVSVLSANTIQNIASPAPGEFLLHGFAPDVTQSASSLPGASPGKSLPPTIVLPHVTRYPSLKTEGPF